MGKSRQPERIEIELTSSDGGPAWARRDGAAVGDDGVAATDVAESNPVGHDAALGRGRIWGMALLAVAALTLGWMLGSAGTDDASADVAPLVSGRSTATTAPASEVISPVEPSEPTGSTPASAPTPSATPDPVGETTTEQVALPVSVQGMPAEIVALGSGREIIRLDLSTGTLETMVNDSPPFGPPTLFVDDDSVLLPSWDEDLLSTLVTDGADPERVDVGPAGQLLSAQLSGVLWRSDFASVGFEAARSEAIGLAGKSLGEPLELPVFPFAADPAGGVVIAAPGGAFQVTIEGPTRITPGRLAAIGPDHAIGHECDESLVCRYVFIERATGSRSPLPLEAALGEQPFFDTTWGPVSVSAFPPNGAFVVLEWVGVETSFRRTLLVLDVRSGAAVELGVDPGSAQSAWSADGRVLFYLLGGRLSALDVITGESDLVSDALFGIETFAVRPLSS